MYRTQVDGVSLFQLTHQPTSTNTPPALRHVHQMMECYGQNCVQREFDLFTLNEAWNCRKATDVQCEISIIECLHHWVNVIWSAVLSIAEACCWQAYQFLTVNFRHGDHTYDVTISREEYENAFSMEGFRLSWWQVHHSKVGGFNPSEKYQSNWIIYRNRDENKTYLKPPPRYFLRTWDKHLSKDLRASVNLHKEWKVSWSLVVPVLLRRATYISSRPRPLLCQTSEGAQWGMCFTVFASFFCFCKVSLFKAAILIGTQFYNIVQTRSFVVGLIGGCML